MNAANVDNQMLFYFKLNGMQFLQFGLKKG